MLQSAFNDLTIVVGAQSWMKWLSPFLQTVSVPHRLIVDQDQSDRGQDRLFETLCGTAGRHVLFLSHHDTLRRDAQLSERLTRATGKSVMAQPMEIARLARNKHDMLKIARRVEGLRVPENLSIDAALGLLETGPRPVIAKPSDQTEGRMCRIFSDPQEFLRFRQDTGLQDAGWMIQRFIAGTEYSVNAIATPGAIQVFEPVWKSENSVSQWTHPANRLRRTPHGETPRALVARMVELTTRYLAQIPANGLVELEYIVDADGDIWFIELNPRLAATTRMVSLASQKSVFCELALAATGQPLSAGLVATEGYCSEIKLSETVCANLDRSGFQFPDFSFSTRATVRGETPAHLNENLGRLLAQIECLEQP